MKNIYLVRHCQAEGQEPDARLTAAGAQQAEELAHFLANKNIDYIISSPFERAIRTITPLAEKLGVEVNKDTRLAERVLSGKNHKEWRDMLRKTYDDLNLCYEGGESSSMAMSRASSVVSEALNSACPCPTRMSFIFAACKISQPFSEYGPSERILDKSNHL
ncbi:histidine phosphatase family protein [Paenibacillus gorillae]|uniref:histidine phosphatase family protein n=1 Tax=Paenibacillus gorillae TaxID=1243662 RepID=UPI0012DD710F|nr:histidine phosphatase family protein [Paenibacillus gorillae]